MVLPRPISSARMQLFNLGKHEWWSNSITTAAINLSVKPGWCLLGRNQRDILAPRMGHPVHTLQLIVPQLQPICANVVRLLLHGYKPWPLFQNLKEIQHLISWTEAVSFTCSDDRRYLAVSGGNVFALIATHVFINALFKFSGNKSAVFPAALGVWQPLPFTKVIWITCGRLLIWMSCEIKTTEKVNKQQSIETKTMGGSFLSPMILSTSWYCECKSSMSSCWQFKYSTSSGDADLSLRATA